MKRLEPELPEEKRIRRQMERKHGDMLPGSLAALEAISEQFKGSAPVTVYWLLADEWNRYHQYVDGEDEVAHNLNAPIKQTFHIPSEILHEVQPRRLRRLTAFVTQQQRRLLGDGDVVKALQFFLRDSNYHRLLRESIYRRHYQAMRWKVKPSKQAEWTIYPVRDMFFNVEHRKVYLMLGEADDNTLEE